VTLPHGIEIEGCAVRSILLHLLAIYLHVDDVVQRKDRGIAGEAGDQPQDDRARRRWASEEHGSQRATHRGMSHVENGMRHPRKPEELLDSYDLAHLRVGHAILLSIALALIARRR